MKPIALVLLAATALGSVAIAQSAAPAAVTAKASPAFGTFGFDEAGMDKSVVPGDDFYAFANGAWTRNTPIPADKSSFGAFEVLQDLSDKRTRGLLETRRRATPTRRSAGAMRPISTPPRSRRKGLAPIKPWLDRIAGLTIEGRLCRAAGRREPRRRSARRSAAA